MKTKILGHAVRHQLRAGRWPPGITMEFQFGMNWSYYSHYVGDIFGAPLAIEGLDGLFPRGDLCRPVLLRVDKLSKVAHLTVAWLVAIGSNFSGAVDS